MQLKNLGLQQQNAQQEIAQRAALAPGQQQLQQAQITGAGQQNQMGAADVQLKQIQVKDQQLLSTLYPQFATKAGSSGSQTPGYDFDGLKQALIKNGASFSAVGQVNAIQAQNADLATKLAGAGEAVIKQHQAANSALNEAVETLQAIPDKDGTGQSRQQALAGILPNLQKMGIDTSQFGQTPLTDANLASFQATLGQHQQVVDEAQKMANLAKSQTEEKGSPDLQAQNSWLSANPGKTAADYAIMMKKLVPAYNFNLQNQGAAGTPGQPSAIAKGLADGSMKWQDVVSARTPMAVKQALLTEVKGIKPDYNSGDFSIEQGVKQEFASGDAAKSLTAFNTAIEHAKQLGTAADALSNGNMPLVNKLTNAIGYNTGSDKTTNFNVIKNALTGEISKVFKGGGATDAEIEAVQGPFSSANSSAQLKGAINNAVQLMNSKREALQQQYQAGIQAKPNFGAGGAQGGGPASNAAPPAGIPHDVIVNGKVVGVTTDGGKTMKPVGAQ